MKGITHVSHRNSRIKGFDFILGIALVRRGLCIGYDSGKHMETMEGRVMKKYLIPTDRQQIIMWLVSVVAALVLGVIFGWGLYKLLILIEGGKMEIETLAVLKDEGKKETITRIMKRRSCDNCGDLAHFKHTFLLPHARINPASQGYGKDDISWCSDECCFACKECKDEMRNMDGYKWCATFSAVSRFAHMFLHWEKV